MPLSPGAIVVGPQATPPLHSLLTAATVVTEGDSRWENGYSFLPEGCVEAAAWDPNPVDAEGECLPRADKSEPGENLGEVSGHPFTIETPLRCSAFGFLAADYGPRARRQLEAATPGGLEAEFWTGTAVPGTFHLDQPGATILDPAAQDALTALALLAEGLAGCGTGARGVIHAPAYIAELWAAQDLLGTDGPRLATRSRGDLVVAGTGYPGTGTDGAAPAADSMWVYATSAVQVRLGPVEVTPDTLPEALDRRTNTVVYRAERTASAVTDGCCHLALQVSR